MKTIIRFSKAALLCIILLAARNSSAQLVPTTFTTTQGVCIDLGIDTLGFTVSTFNILSGPFNGQLVPGIRPGSWIYCPDSLFIGTDQANVYVCISGPTFPICDTVQAIFVVQQNNPCNLTVTLYPDSTPCAGPLPSLGSFVTGGTPPYFYSWSNGVTGNEFICNLTPNVYCLTVSDFNGCSVSSCYTVGCQITVSVAMDSFSCLLSVAVGGTPPYAYLWSDGTTGSSLCNANPLMTYTVAVTDSNGCYGTATYFGGGCQMVAAIVQDSLACPARPGLTVVTTGGTPPYTYAWSDGSSSQTICINTYAYCVTVTDANQCYVYTCYTVGCQLPVTIGLDSSGCLLAGASGGNPPYQYMWDNFVSSPINCVQGFPGTYCVTVYDNLQCSGTACYNYQTGSSCSFSYTQSNPLFQNLVLFSASFDPVLSPAMVFWNLGDGTTANGTHLFYQYDTCNVVYTVTMTLVDSLGNTLCTYSQPLNIYCNNNRYCQAYFTSYQDSASNMTFHFADQSVYNPVTYAWDFGDGNSSTLQNPSHTYTTPGFYNVCLVITDANGCASTYCQQVNAGNVQIQDLQANLYHYTTVTPGFPVWVSLSYCNFGTTLMSGTVEYRYPAGTTFVSATPPPASHDPVQRLLTFNFTNLLPGSCGYIAVDLMANNSLTLGSTANDTMWVLPIAGDINPANNVSTVSDIVVGSWDPNDKAVSPKGLGEDGDIPVSTESLSYLVRFQNTGTATAQNVVIRDAMDNSIDLTSVQVTSASHAHTTEIIGNELVVSFHNIMLPDSGTNEALSHGQITVYAKLKPGLTEGTQINNTAEIYFDFNPAVITNTVVNTLRVATGIRIIDGLDFSMIPNPTNNRVSITGKFSKGSTFEFFNSLGQELLKGELNSNRTEVDLTQLQTGIYFVKVKSKDKFGAQRLVVEK